MFIRFPRLHFYQISQTLKRRLPQHYAALYSFYFSCVNRLRFVMIHTPFMIAPTLRKSILAKYLKDNRFYFINLNEFTSNSNFPRIRLCLGLWGYSFRVPCDGVSSVNDSKCNKTFTHIANAKSGFSIVSYVTNPLLSDASNEPRQGLLPIFVCKKDKFEPVLRDRLGFTFTFVRNPYTRAYSAYLNRACRYFSPNNEGYNFSDQSVLDPMLRFYGTDIRSIRNGDATISFADYIRFITLHNRNFDGHHVSQTDAIIPEILNFDFIGKLENFASDMKYVLDQIGAPQECYRRINERVNTSNNKKPLHEVYDDETQSLIYDNFRDDFTNFGYNKELPS